MAEFKKHQLKAITLRQEILTAYDTNELNKAKLGQAGLKLESVRGDLNTA